MMSQATTQTATLLVSASTLHTSPTVNLLSLLSLLTFGLGGLQMPFIATTSSTNSEQDPSQTLGDPTASL
jgi:hypothetical protein